MKITAEERQLIHLSSTHRELTTALHRNTRALRYLVLCAARTGTPHDRIADLTGLPAATVTDWLTHDLAAAKATKDRLLARTRP